MSPALLDPAAPAYTIPRNPSLNGQFSHPLPFNFSGFPSKVQSVTMNPSNIGNQTSGFSNYSSSNIGFNASSFSGSASASSRPRMVKLRKQSNSQNLSPTGASDARGDIGFNPFRPLPESKVSGSSASETGTYVSAGLGSAKSGSEVFVFGANTIDSGVPLEKEVIEELRNLRIETGKEFVNAKDGGGNLNANSPLSSSLSGGLESGGFGFESGYKKTSVIDESIASKLPEEMMKLKIEGQGKAEGIEEVRDVRFILRANNTTNFGVGSSDNVGSSFVKSAEAELPNEFNTKLDIKEPADTLPNQMNNLNIKDSLGTNDKKSEVNVETNDKDYTVFGSRESTSVSYGGKETLLSRKMEKLKLGSGAGDSNQPDAGPSSYREFVKEIQMGHFSDALFRDRDKSVTTEFTFQLEMQGKDEIGSQDPLAPSKADTKLGGNVASSASFSTSNMGFPPVGNAFEVPKAEFRFTSKQEGTGTPFVEFKTPKPKADLFSGLKQKMEFNTKNESMRDTRVKKKGGKLKHARPVQLWPGQDFVARESVSQENPEVSESYSPMDISPYQETPVDNQFSRENSVTSDESFRLDNSYEATNSTPTVSSDAIDEDVIIATQCLDINEDKSICQEPKFVSSKDAFDESVGLGGPKEESVSVAETESFKSAAEEVDYNSDGTVTSRETDAIPSSNMERPGYGKRQIGVASSWEDISGFNFTFAASFAAQGQLSASKRQQKKKTLLKVGHDSYDSTLSPKVSYASSSVNLFPFSGTSLTLSPGRGQKGDLSSSRSRVATHSELEKRQEIKQESAAIVAAQDLCEKWRQRGNQAYMNGELSKAEECYTEGVNCISRCETSRSCLRVLMLCYSNRAATRMSLGRMRDAIGDCMMAAAIDPNFLKVQLRAANCYLVLGEVEDASKYFKRCLQSGSEICVDRKIVVEASDGLQKAQKVLECMNRSAELLKRSTANDAETALEVIAKAVVISSYSERLLEMKAEALFMLRKYDEVTQLCDQTLGSAEKNFPPAETSGQQLSLNGSEILKSIYFRVWRCCLIFKAYFHLGRLEEGLAVLEQEEKESITNRSGNKSLESLIPLAVTVRELLRQKASGNEAFQAGRHAEAVEHYTAALSYNVESRPFVAVCFCNRAAAYKALGQITDAIADCSLAIALDGNYLKAISRRATLYEMIRDYGQAAKDIQRLVSLQTKQLEEKTTQSGALDKSVSSVSDLRQSQLRLSEIEEEARKEIPLDMYLILGVEPSVSASEIKKAYRKAALRNHPDKAGQSLARSDNADDKLWKEIAEEVQKDADKLFKMIGEAYALLSDSIKRSRYDAEEEMRNAQKKRDGSGTSRTHTDAQGYPFERSGSRRQWREVWRSYGSSPSRGSEGNRWARYS